MMARAPQRCFPELAVRDAPPVCQIPEPTKPPGYPKCQCCSINPSCSAFDISPATELTPSFCVRDARCFSAVLGLTPIMSAISGLLLPATIMLRDWRSRGVSSPTGAVSSNSAARLLSICLPPCRISVSFADSSVLSGAFENKPSTPAATMLPSKPTDVIPVITD